MRRIALIAAVFAFTLSWEHAVVGQQTSAGSMACTPGELRTDSTPNCVSIEWDVSGDSDHDAKCSVQYREKGTEKWKQALPLFRVDYQWWYHTSKAERALNIFAGSILFLKAGTTYEVNLDLADPDGGEADEVISVATRPIPQLPKGVRTFHVAPGSGEGSGSADDPFRGLAQAEATARPGDVCLLHQGNYGSYAFQKSGEPGSYIVWKSAGDGDVVFASLQVRASHIWLEGVNLQRQKKTPGLRAGSKCTDVVVRRNRFDGFHYSILLNRDSRYWHITDNVIVGDNDPETGGISGEGIELSHSSGHTVAYNDISGVADGISYPDRNCDIYGNDIHDVSDDGLEPDYAHANVRMWNNRIYNYHYNGLSFQPMYCGPWYFIRNQVIGTGSIFKFRVQDRFVLVNNTFVKWGSMGNRMHHILTSLSRNNLYVSADGKAPIWAAIDCNQPQYCLPNVYITNWMTNVDYDGFDWGRSATAFRWENRKRFPDLESFAEAVGIERHGIRVKKEEIFERWDIPAEPGAVSPQHLTLKAGSSAIDAGDALPNINDDFSGKAPDLGAYEFGKPLPQYGPRGED